MKTEAEAKTKWCPFARVHQSVYDRELVMNRTDTDWPVGSCIASGCMAWRETGKKVWKAEPGEDAREPEAVGFCGLSGAAYLIPL